MTKKHLLFIDDEDITSVLDRMVNKAKAEKMEVTYELCDPLGFLDKNSDIDEKAFFEELEKKYLIKKYDLIACDCRLGTIDRVFAIRIVEKIRIHNKTASILIYSGLIRDIINEIFQPHVKGKSPSKTKTKKAIESPLKTILKSNIADFVSREDLTVQVLELLKSPSMALQLENELLTYGNLVFNDGNADLDGKKLGEVAEQIRKQTKAGIEFTKEIFEITIAHIIKLNKK